MLLRLIHITSYQAPIRAIIYNEQEARTDGSKCGYSIGKDEVASTSSTRYMDYPRNGEQL